MIAFVACLPTDPYTKDPYTNEEPNIVDNNYGEKKEAYTEKKEAYTEKKSYSAKSEYKPEYKKPEVKAYRADTSYSATEKYAEKTATVDKTVQSQAVTTTAVVSQPPAILPVPFIINPFDPFNPLSSFYNPYAPLFNPYGYIHQYTQLHDVSPLNPANPLSPLNPDSPYYNGAFAAYFYGSTTSQFPFNPHSVFPTHPEVPFPPAVPVTPPVRHYY